MSSPSPFALAGDNGKGQYYGWTPSVAKHTLTTTPYSAKSATGTAVTFWGAQWSQLNPLSTGSAPNSFKGFALKPTTPSCGTGWSTDRVDRAQAAGLPALIRGKPEAAKTKQLGGRRPIGEASVQAGT